jgi:hypothetical protein
MSNFNTELYENLSSDWRNFDIFFDGIEIHEGMDLKTPYGDGVLVDFQLKTGSELQVLLKTGESKWVSSLSCRALTMLNV